MPQPNGFAARDSFAAARLKLLLLPPVDVAASVGWLAAGIGCFWLRANAAQPGSPPAVVGVLLVSCALAQLRLAWPLWNAGAHARSAFGRPVFWRLFAAGALVAYLAVLVVGPARHAAWAWLVAVGVWQTMLLFVLGPSTGRLHWLHTWTGGRIRHLAWFVYAPLCLLVAAEGGLRAYRAALEHRPANLQSDGISHFGGPQELAAPRLKGARFRVAIMGDATVYGRGYLSRVEQSAPAVEVVSLASSVTWPGAGAADVGSEVRRSDPDLVLAVLSVCEDLAREPAQCGYFDWRQFELAGLFLGNLATEANTGAPASADNFEGFLHGLRPQLAACRTPIDGAMRARWERVFASLNEVVAGCREAGVPLALVVVPAQFQVNPALRETLLRRNGLSADRLDVELPQRRLAGYALDRGVPLIDLLPHLRLCRQSVYLRHSSAMSEEGNVAAASAIRGWLESRYGGELAAQLSKAE
jgi:hypothetical protein